jgi:hypothetical protein
MYPMWDIERKRKKERQIGKAELGPLLFNQKNQNQSSVLRATNFLALPQDCPSTKSGKRKVGEVGLSSSRLLTSITKYGESIFGRRR